MIDDGVVVEEADGGRVTLKFNVKDLGACMHALTSSTTLSNRGTA